MGWSVAALAAAGVASGALKGYGTIKSSKYEAQGVAMQSAAQASNLLLQGASVKANAEMSAANYDAQAEYYLRQAGQFQLQGREERASRGLQLGEDAGRIRAGAAGSGIEASSRVVQKVVDDTSMSAYRDMEISARNEYENAHGALKNRATAILNARNQREIGSWASRAYSSLAGQVQNAGRISAENIVEGGYSNAFIGVVTGGLGGLAGGMSS